MIKKDKLQRLWKRTLWQLGFVDVVGIGVVASLAYDRSQMRDAPSYPVLAGILLALFVANLVFYWVARSIRGNIERRYGQD